MKKGSKYNNIIVILLLIYYIYYICIKYYIIFIYIIKWENKIDLYRRTNTNIVI